MKKVDAEVLFEVYVDCPKCTTRINVLEEVREYMDKSLSVENINEEMKCRWCKEIFIIESIVY